MDWFNFGPPEWSQAASLSLLLFNSMALIVLLLSRRRRRLPPQRLVLPQYPDVQQAELFQQQQQPQMTPAQARAAWKAQMARRFEAR